MSCFNALKFQQPKKLGWNKKRKKKKFGGQNSFRGSKSLTKTKQWQQHMLMLFWWPKICTICLAEIYCCWATWPIMNGIIPKFNCRNFGFSVFGFMKTLILVSFIMVHHYYTLFKHKAGLILSFVISLIHIFLDYPIFLCLWGCMKHLKEYCYFCGEF